MRTFFIILLFFLLFNGCAQQNAFERFDISKNKEHIEENIQTLKLKKGSEVAGIATVVYLNKVFPQEYKEREYFYIYYYVKDQNAKVHFLLNGKKALSRKLLPADNRFAKLVSFEAPWSKYYLVSFAKEGRVLHFTIQTDTAAKATLQFVKDK